MALSLLVSWWSLPSHWITSCCSPYVMLLVNSLKQILCGLCQSVRLMVFVVLQVWTHVMIQLCKFVDTVGIFFISHLTPEFKQTMILKKRCNRGVGILTLCFGPKARPAPSRLESVNKVCLVRPRALPKLLISAMRVATGTGLRYFVPTPVCTMLQSWSVLPPLPAPGSPAP